MEKVEKNKTETKSKEFRYIYSYTYEICNFDEGIAMYSSTFNELAYNHTKYKIVTMDLFLCVIHSVCQ